MIGRSGASPQAARGAERQPTNFDGLDTIVVEVDDIIVTRALACPCGSQTGRVRAGEQREDGGRLDPLTFVCDACDEAVKFFDSARDGYDGRFGNGTSYHQASTEAEVGCPACGGRSLGVRCRLHYNIDASERDEQLGEQIHLLSDYFDALTVNAVCASCRRKFGIGDWELA